MANDESATTEGPAADVARAVFEMFRAVHSEATSSFVDDPEAVVDEAAARFDHMIPELAYLDTPDDPMAAFLFEASATLAIYLTLADRGVDVHDFGAALLQAFARFTETMAEPPVGPGSGVDFEQVQLQAQASQRDARPGEFVYEAVGESGSSENIAVNIISCGICHQFAKYDAMDLVPYICATDDVVSDHFGQGLRRSGTIALGAHQCDFQYHAGGEPQRIADQYPQQVRLRTSR